mmetsp:Transcript_12588/g.30906  ORF Transcript_12588/g.30906 Transcript_12588/m.30906 type:complete len:276 (+) Transcript_12588:515-1342(+)
MSPSLSAMMMSSSTMSSLGRSSSLSSIARSAPLPRIAFSALNAPRIISCLRPSMLLSPGESSGEPTAFFEGGLSFLASSAGFGMGVMRFVVLDSSSSSSSSGDSIRTVGMGSSLLSPPPGSAFTPGSPGRSPSSEPGFFPVMGGIPASVASPDADPSSFCEAPPNPYLSASWCGLSSVPEGVGDASALDACACGGEGVGEGVSSCLLGCIDCIVLTGVWSMSLPPPAPLDMCAERSSTSRGLFSLSPSPSRSASAPLPGKLSSRFASGTSTAREL